MTREELNRRREEIRAERKAEQRKRQENLAKRRNAFTDEDWRDLEWMRARLDEIMRDNPQAQHALYHAYANIRDYTEIA